MWKDLARSQPLGGYHTGPWPLIWPPQTPLVGGLWSAGIPAATTGNWLDTIGTAPKTQEDQVA